jgi:hypothetical protein
MKNFISQYKNTLKFVVSMEILLIVKMFSFKIFTYDWYANRLNKDCNLCSTISIPNVHLDFFDLTVLLVLVVAVINISTNEELSFNGKIKFFVIYFLFLSAHMIASWFIIPWSK